MKKILLVLVIPLLLGASCGVKNIYKPENIVVNEEKILVEDKKTNTDIKDKLDLSSQGLSQVSQSVFEQTNLQELDVSNNKLTGSLPAEIRYLQKLQILNASNNQMTGVPAEIGQLNNLLELNLSNNGLTGLPYELGNLKNLRILDLSGNQVSKQDLDIIRNNLSPNVDIIE
jgi:Leucine-rich repeat (LRR) protein